VKGKWGAKSGTGFSKNERFKTRCEDNETGGKAQETRTRMIKERGVNIEEGMGETEEPPQSQGGVKCKNHLEKETLKLRSKMCGEDKNIRRTKNGTEAHWDIRAERPE